MIVFLIIYIVGLLFFAWHVYSLPLNERTKAKTSELLMLYFIVFGIGITSFLSFFALTFMGDLVASYTEWPRCPYEQELANVNLAYGVLGICAIWYRKHFWTAIVIGFSIWILGDAIHHHWDGAVNGIHSHGNEGALFYSDLLFPPILILVYYFYRKYNSLPNA